MSVKTLKTVKLFPKISFNMDIMDPYLLTWFIILLKSSFEGVIKMLLSDVVLPNVKVTEPEDV